MTVCRAEMTDIPWLLEQLRAFDRFFGGAYALFPKDVELARQLVSEWIRHQVFFVAWHAGPPSSRIGFIGGPLGPHPYNPELVALTELFWWVVPQHRGTHVGARLLLEFEEHARANGAHLVVLSLEETTIERGMVDPSSLTRRGYRPKERSYLLELERATV